MIFQYTKSYGLLYIVSIFLQIVRLQGYNSYNMKITGFEKCKTKGI